MKTMQCFKKKTNTRKFPLSTQAENLEEDNSLYLSDIFLVQEARHLRYKFCHHKLTKSEYKITFTQFGEWETVLPKAFY